MSTLPPDYDSDPGRWRSWEAPRDVHHLVGPELRGPVLDIGCGEGRLASVLADGVPWVGLERAEQVDVPLWLTKRGVLVRAIKP